MYNKADTHIHTTFSDGLASPQEIVEYVATRTDLRVIAITDHDTTAGAFAAREYALRRWTDLDIIIGQEVTTGEGDVVGLFLRTTLPTFRTAAAAVEAIHAQGGLAVAVHPFSKWATFGQMGGLGHRILDLPLDGVEVRNGFPANMISNRLTAWFNRRGQRLSELGGSDSHAPCTVGQAFTWFPGDSAGDLRQAMVRRVTRADGTLWRPTSMVQLASALLKHGLPARVGTPQETDDLSYCYARNDEGGQPKLHK